MKQKTVTPLRRSSRLSSAKPIPITKSIRPCTFPLDAWLDEAGRAERFRKILKRRLHKFKGHFRYGPDKEERTGILSSGQTFASKEDSCGTTWIALHGTVPYSVVAMDTCPDRGPRIYSRENRPPVSAILRSVLVQMGDTSSALRQEVAKHSITGPFAIVSIAPGTVDDCQEESSKKAYSRAVDFITEKLKGRSDLTHRETVQIAVCALKLLFGSKFQANGIKTFNYDGVSWDGRYGITLPEVEKYLNDLNSE